MEANATGGFLRFFTDLPDPRTGNFVRYSLHSMIIIAIMAVICGADGWVQIEEWGNCKLEWLKTFLDLPYGIPSHDTFGRVFSLIDPNAFERCFLSWVATMVDPSVARQLAIDGKALRQSFLRGWDKSGMAHLVTALVSQGDNRLVFSQVAVEKKENEIVAIPALLKLLDLHGATVTIDAMGCQRAIAQQIVEGGGDYILPTKDNQEVLAEKVDNVMQDLILDHKKGQEAPIDYFEQIQEDHGRKETRRVWVSNAVEHLSKDLRDKWAGLATMVVVERTRQNYGDFTGKVSVEQCCYISSIKNASAETIAQLIRGHWSIENQLHWQLDVSFREDDCRIRKGHGAENYSRLRRIAVNILARAKTLKVGMKTKRLIAGWSNDHLLRLIQP